MKLEFKKVNIRNTDHRVILNELLYDPDIAYYIQPFNAYSFEEMEVYYENIKNMNEYLVYDKSVNDYIGYFAVKTNENPVDLRYAVREEYRGLGYSKKMLTDYIISNKIEDVKLTISENNIYSRNIAEDLGFENGELMPGLEEGWYDYTLNDAYNRCSNMERKR